MDLRWLAAGDEDALVTAGALFDYPVRDEWVREFLSRPGHYLCVAYQDGVPAGFVTGVEMTHPDKGTEMFLYELGVAEPYRGQGIGRALVKALANLALVRDCYGMWVLTDKDNDAALRTYRSGGAVDTAEQVMLGWRLEPDHPTFTDPT
jgi:ribosomal protein S18 acetylase RimI-like enzyme